MKFRWVLTVLILGLVARGTEDILPALGVGRAVNVSNLSAVVQYCVMFVGGFMVIRHSDVTLREMFGRLTTLRELMLGVLVGALLLGVTLGLNALVVWTVTQWSPLFAYRLWSFHAEPYVLAIPIGAHILLGVNQFMVSPFVEEFMFRGLMFRSLLRNGPLVSIFLAATIFGVLHLPQPYWVSTLFFSVMLSLLYVKYRSLWPGIFAHATYNASAFFLQYHVQFHYQRPATHLAGLRYWVPELVMLLVAVPALAGIVMHCWPALNDWKFNPSGSCVVSDR